MEIVKEELIIAPKKNPKKRKWILFFLLAVINSGIILGSTFAILEANSKITIGEKV